MKRIKKEKKPAGDWLRISFECLRRNEKYQEKFKKIKELWDRIDDITLTIRFEKARGIRIDSSGTIPWNPQGFAQQMRKSNIEILIKETKKAFEEFDLNYVPKDGLFNIPHLPDPNKSFRELWWNDFDLKNLFLIFGKNAVTFTQIVDIDNEEIYSERFRIDINFKDINSIDALKDHITFALDEHWKRYKNKRRNWSDFDNDLQIGDKIKTLKKKNPSITWSELARVIFYEHCEDWDNEPTREALITKARRLYERYMDMIENGWRNLGFP